MKQILKEWNDCQKMKMFEIGVIDTRTNEKEFLLFDINIDIENGTFNAQHDALTKEEVSSQYIPHKTVKIDTMFSLDENLQALYDVCIESIINSTWYKLA